MSTQISKEQLQALNDIVKSSNIKVLKSDFEVDKQTTLPKECVHSYSYNVLQDGTVLRNLCFHINEGYLSIKIDKSVPVFATEKLNAADLKDIIESDITISSYKLTKAGEAHVKKDPSYNLKEPTCSFKVNREHLGKFAESQAANLSDDELGDFDL